MADRLRVQFDFSEDALARLDTLKEYTKARNRGDVVRNALRLYEWFVNEFGDDHEVILRRESDDKELRIPTAMLL